MALPLFAARHLPYLRNRADHGEGGPEWQVSI